MTREFDAPWSTRLKVITSAALLFLAAVGGSEVQDLVGRGEAGKALLLGGVLLGIVLGCAAFAIRGYRVEPGALHVLRPGWANTFDLSRLRSVRLAPGATAGSLRTFGIGGLFGFVGRFRNPELGAYRAYATDSTRLVVVELEDETVVVTPGRPADFVDTVRAATGNGDAAEQ